MVLRTLRICCTISRLKKRRSSRADRYISSARWAWHRHLRVSKDTTRNEVGQFLCAGSDPSTLAVPSLHVCDLSESNANAQHLIADGHGDVVIVASPGSATAAHPDNRVWYEPGRLMSAGGRQFLNGGTIPAGPDSNGQLITYRFLKTGRYLVICMNRTHFLNDWMFGFVNVAGN